MGKAPPAKRKRTGDSSGDADTTPVRSKIWMRYGDIILQAESTQFRVNRDILAQQSSVFKDMFDLPLPADEPTVEGCPIVHVSDTAKDWELLLEVLYQPFQPSASRPFAVVAAMLRLGKKYDISAARDDALLRLHSEFPAEFEVWNSGTEQLTKVDFQDGIYPDLLNLLHECGIYTCIPTLGLECLNSHTLEALFAGVSRSDASRAIVPNDIKLALAIAAERIIVFQKSALAWLENDAIIPHKTCRMHERCIRQKMVLNQSAAWRLKGRIDIGYTVHPWNVDWSGVLCDVCEKAAKDYYKASCHRGWALLPTFFGLSEWKDLKDLE
ncbi:hypothetical protein B0H12DRAFT_327372 [Mycena haematopus]|nr:hypothetical protein B0H12DRAFT_327372 [Mycena haematopus]